MVLVPWPAMVAIITVCCVAAGVATAAAQSGDDINALRSRVSKLYAQGNYAEAAPVAERYVEVARKRHGEEHVEFASAIWGLGSIFQAQGRATEAEPLYKRTSPSARRRSAPTIPMSPFAQQSGRLYETKAATPRPSRSIKRAWRSRESARPRASDVATSLNNLALLYERQGRYAEAEPLYQRASRSARRRSAPTIPTSATSLNNLAVLVREPRPLRRGRAALQARLAIHEKALGPTIRCRTIAQQPGGLYESQGRYAEAEPLYKRALAIREKALGPEHPDCRAARSTTWPRCTEAKAATPRPSRSTSARWRSARKRSAPSIPMSRTRSTTWPDCTEDQGRYAEAEPLYKRSARDPRESARPRPSRCRQRSTTWPCCTRAKAATPRPSRSTSAQPRDQREGARPRAPRRRARRSTTWPSCTRTKAATPRPSRSTSARWRSARKRSAPTTPTSPSRSTTWPRCTQPKAATPRPSRSISAPCDPREGARPRPSRCRHLAQQPGRAVPSPRPLRRGRAALQARLAIREKALGPDHPDVARSLNNLAGLVPRAKRLGAGRRLLAAQHGGDYAARRARRGVGKVVGKGRSGAMSWQFRGLVKVAHRLAARGAGAAWQTRCSRPHNGRKARRPPVARPDGCAAAKGGPLAALFASGRILVANGRRKDKELIAAKSEAPDERKPEAEKALAGGLPPIDTRIGEIDKPLAKDFPDYAALRAQGRLDRRRSGPASRRRSVGAVPRHARRETDARGDLHLGRDQDGQPLGEERHRHQGTQERVAALRCGLDTPTGRTRAMVRCERRMPSSASKRRSRGASAARPSPGPTSPTGRRRPSMSRRRTSYTRRCLARSKTSSRTLTARPSSCSLSPRDRSHSSPSRCW